MYRNDRIPYARMLTTLPAAAAVVRGNDRHPDLHGIVKLYPVANGTLIAAEITGLPAGRGKCSGPIFAFHIHEGGSCSGNATDPFASAGAHYNPGRCKHPYHAGDLPPLFGAGGTAFSAFVTDRFAVEDVIGKTVMIHASPDDFMSQPAGNAGARIACGEILPTRR